MSTDNLSRDGDEECVLLETTLPHSQCSGITESGSILHPATTDSSDGNQEQNTSKPVVQNGKRLDSPDVGVVSRPQQSFVVHP